MRRRNKGRVVVLESVTTTSQVELAAQLRRDGFTVVSVAPEPRTMGERLQDWANRLVFTETWRVLPPPGTELPAQVVDRVLAQPTLDVHGNDYDGRQLALRGAQSELDTRSLVVGPEWFDKRHLALVLEELGIPGPRWSDSPDGQALPLVVKSRVTTGGMGVRICRDARQFAEAWQELGGPEGEAFVQELRGDEIVATTGVARDGEVLAHETYLFVGSPHSPTAPAVAQVMVDRPDLLGNVRILMRATGHTGLFNVQQFVDDNGRGMIFDFNPRCPASWAAIDAAGSGLSSVYLAMLAGEPIPEVVPLPVGTRGVSLQLTYADPMADWSELRDWWRECGVLMRQRRRTLGWRFFAWSQLMRARLAIRSWRRMAAVDRARSLPDESQARRAKGSLAA